MMFFEGFCFGIILTSIFLGAWAIWGRRRRCGIEFGPEVKYVNVVVHNGGGGGGGSSTFEEPSEKTVTITKRDLILAIGKALDNFGDEWIMRGPFGDMHIRDLTSLSKTTSIRFLKDLASPLVNALGLEDFKKTLHEPEETK